MAAIAQLGERQTEDLKVPCSIHGRGTLLHNAPEGSNNARILKQIALAILFKVKTYLK